MIVRLLFYGKCEERYVICFIHCFNGKQITTYDQFFNNYISKQPTILSLWPLYRNTYLFGAFVSFYIKDVNFCLCIIFVSIVELVFSPLIVAFKDRKVKYNHIQMNATIRIKHTHNYLENIYYKLVPLELLKEYLKTNQ